MRKLLSVNLVQLLRDKIFWAALAFMAISTAILVVSTYNMVSFYGYDPGEWTAEASMFCMLPGLGIINAIWLHLLIGNDFDQGTIRNKLICGHRRSAIFFSHWLTAAIGSLLLLAVSLSIGTMLSGYLFRTFTYGATAIAWFYLCCALLTIAYSAISVVLAMNIGHKASSVVCGMLVMLALSICASIVGTLLSDLRSTTWEPVTLKDHLVLFVYDLLPSGQCMQINNLMFEHAGRWPLYSLLLIVIVTGIGYLLFKRKDIK